MSFKFSRKTLALGLAGLIIVLYAAFGITRIEDGKIGFVSPRIAGKGWILDSGLKWIPPLLFKVSKVQKEGAEINRKDGFSVTDTKGNAVEMGYNFTYNVSDPKKALEKFGSGDLYLSVRDYIEAELKKQSAELCTVPEDYQFMAAAVINELRGRKNEYGIEPVHLDVQLKTGSEQSSVADSSASSAGDVLTPYSISEESITHGGVVDQAEMLKGFEKEVGEFDKTQPPTYYNNRGSILYNQGKYREAELEYKKFVLLRPNSYVPFVNLYHVFRKQNRWDEAFFYIEEAMKRKLAEGDNFAYVMAVDFLKADDIEKGKRMLELGVKYYPDNYYLNLNLGTVLVNEKQFPEAVKCYLAALKVNPKSIQAMNNLAMLYYMTGNMRLAAQYWKQSLDTNPNQPALLEFLNKVDEQLKKAQEKQAAGK